jgi:hypothetical protein
MNRRIRSRTYGGVRGRGLKGPLLLDTWWGKKVNRAVFVLQNGVVSIGIWTIGQFFLSIMSKNTISK